MKHRVISGKKLLANSIEKGIPEPEVLEPDILLKGKAHQFYAEAASGKSWLALWLAKQAIERGERVMYLDMEMGYRTVSERLQAMEVDTSRMDELLHYYAYPSLDIQKESIAAYVNTLDEAKPALIIFDSWLTFLTGCGMEENSNSDISDWSTHYLHPCRVREITTVILDHVPHDAKRSRGASRKKDEVDVQWAVKKKKEFNRQTKAKLEIDLTKDREGWLPDKVAFRVGGSPFVFERTDVSSTVTEVKLSPNALKLKDFLKERGNQGARWNEIVMLLGNSTGSASNAIAELRKAGFLYQEKGQPYYYVGPESSLDESGSEGFNEGSNEQVERGNTERVQEVQQPFRVEPLNSDAESDAPYYPTDNEPQETIECTGKKDCWCDRCWEVG